jgi:osmotically-inducible protein OsmY
VAENETTDLVVGGGIIGGKIAMKTDTELQQDVMTELKWEPTIKAAEIGVGVKDGVVMLSGYVDSFWKKWSAERAAARVFGVKAVAEEIQVRLPGSLKRSDEDIARAASDTLEWNVAVPHDRIKVQVQNEVVTLSGEVDWWYQKDAADDAVRKLVGVVLVSNQITVKPTGKPQDVKDKIESAFQRNALLDARRVTVETRGSKVILRGSVRNWAEKEQVEWAAWAAPGVSEVESHIMFSP